MSHSGIATGIKGLQSADFFKEPLVSVATAIRGTLVPISACSHAQNALQAGMIIAGWDAHEGGAVYALPLGGTLLKVPFSIGASRAPVPGSASCLTCSLPVMQNWQSRQPCRLCVHMCATR